MVSGWMLIGFRASSWLACALMAAFAYTRIRTIPGRYNAALLWTAYFGLVAGFWYVINPIRLWWTYFKNDSGDPTSLIALVVALLSITTIISASRAVHLSRKRGSRVNAPNGNLGSDDDYATLGTELAAHRLDARLPAELQLELTRLMNTPDTNLGNNNSLVIPDPVECNRESRR